MNSETGEIFGQSIIGRIENGWTVTEFLKKNEDFTGGAYSLTFKVKKDEEFGFLKVYDFQSYIEKYPEKEQADIQKLMLSHYIYERNLHTACSKRSIDKVCYAIGAGSMKIEVIPGIPPLLAHYLIFKLAESDVHKRIFDQQIESKDALWKFKMLHHTAIAMKQLYSVQIYHQDLKPSNVLCFSEDDYKISDLGRSFTKREECPFASEPYWGDKRYLAPEISYQSPPDDESMRAKMTDLYLFGSLIYHSFSYQCYSSKLYSELDYNFHSGGTVSYEQVLPQLQEIHIKIIQQFKESLRFPPDINDKLADCVYSLCHPDYKQRHHPQQSSPQYNHMVNLEKLISTFDFLTRKLQLYNKSNK